MSVLLEAFDGQVLHLDVGTSQEVDAVGQSVVAGIDHAAYACLDDEFGAFDAG